MHDADAVTAWGTQVPSMSASSGSRCSAGGSKDKSAHWSILMHWGKSPPLDLSAPRALWPVPPAESVCPWVGVSPPQCAPWLSSPHLVTGAGGGPVLLLFVDVAQGEVFPAQRRGRGRVKLPRPVLSLWGNPAVSSSAVSSQVQAPLLCPPLPP